MKGKFIVFEGIDGSGKTTLARLTGIMLDALKKQNIVTQEPFFPLTKTITTQKTVCQRAKILSFLADRAEHVDKVIKPALERGDTVICDRFLLSTLAYGKGEGIFFNDVVDLHYFACGGEWLTPDIIFYCDIGLDDAVKRLKCRGETPDMKFLQQVQEYYNILKLSNDYRIGKIAFLYTWTGSISNSTFRIYSLLREMFDLVDESQYTLIDAILKHIGETKYV